MPPDKPLNLIAACAENRVMGRQGKPPWHIPEDFAWLQEKTAGTVVVLGRLTFAAWPRARLDGRRPVVITRDRSLAGGGVLVADSVPSALAIAQRLPGEIMVCGGQRVFAETLLLAHRLYLTLVHAEIPGDAYFPEWRHLAWREVSRRESHDSRHRYTFFVLERS
ncbi:MAG: dihydrofolate reductase [Opitutaceae bacterium]|nr:dihydrofolate reductase [Opitutaceae bacterium]